MQNVPRGNLRDAGPSELLLLQNGREVQAEAPKEYVLINGTLTDNPLSGMAILT